MVGAGGIQADTMTAAWMAPLEEETVAIRGESSGKGAPGWRQGGIDEASQAGKGWAKGPSRQVGAAAMVSQRTVGGEGSAGAVPAME